MTRSERWVYRVLMCAGGGALIAFYGWWFQPRHVPTNFTGPWHALDLAIFGLLTYVISQRVFMEVYGWVVARKITPIVPTHLPRQDYQIAFVTTFVPGVEGLDLLSRTLPAMLAADLPHDVWLLDEGDDPDARALCDKLGVYHFSRCGRREYNLRAGPFTRRTKGGNHNAWYLDYGHEYDIIAQIDTDFVPRRDFLTRTIGYFDDPLVGWVITPQIYGNDDNLVTRGAAEQQFNFYGPVLRGLDGRRMANMLGANHVVRFAALEDIGLYAGHITEDLLTGIRLHARGWESRYVAEPLAIGEGPDSWSAYFNQQQRWAYGCMDILRHHTPKEARTMRPWQAGLYLSLQQGYFSGLAGAIGTALLVAFFVGGVDLTHMTLPELLIWGTPFFLERHIIRLWMQRFFVRPGKEGGLHLAGGLISAAVWPLYFSAFVKVFRQQPLVFAVTPKGSSSRATRPAGAFRWHLWWGAVNAFALAVGVAVGRHSIVLDFWAITNTTLLLGLYFFGERLQAWSKRDRGQQPAHPSPGVHPLPA